MVSHNVGGSWTAPVGFGVLPQSVALAVAPNGEIHLAYDIEVENVFWRRFKDGAWSDPVDIDSGALTDAQQFVDLAVDDNGNVFAAWAETTFGVQTMTDIWVRRFDAVQDDWGGALVVGDAPRLIGFDVQVEAAANNRAAVAWLQQIPLDPNDQSNREELFASVFDGTSWLPGERIGRDNVVTDADTTEFLLDVNAPGSAIVIWAQDNENAGLSYRWEIGAIRYDAPTGQWTGPETIATTDAGFRTFGVDAAMNDSGEIIVGWRNQTGVDFASISDFDTGTLLWGAVTSFPGEADGSGRRMELSRDAAGATIAAWIESDRDRKGAFVRRREAGSTTWGTDVQINSADTFSELFVVTSPAGYTLLVTVFDVFQADDFEALLIANIYTP